MELYCYLVTYDISSPRRWRKIYQTMLGFGEHVQLSVFRCDLTAERMVELKMIVEALIRHDEDQVVIAKLGRSTKQVIGAIEVLGRPRQFRLPAPQVV